MENKEAKRKFEEACKSKSLVEKIVRKNSTKNPEKGKRLNRKIRKRGNRKKIGRSAKKSKERPKHNMAGQEKSKKKKRPRLQHKYGRWQSDNTPWRNKNPHRGILQGPLPSEIILTYPWYETWTTHISDTVKKITEPRTINTPSQRNETITELEIKKAIKKLLRKKSLGPDEIPNEVFIESNKKVRDILLKTINNIHSTEEIPPSWLQGEIIRLYKGKGNKAFRERQHPSAPRSVNE